ncbi:hypothetical protein [Actinopolyspora mortivallis]|uniref:Uncharacterized protein n=1 Tax=Actinopolyspora mortivallis TaxID=33906 RepID=A0A2T0H066_ACTMO|nr:hypothetical protein [Actinopolyspora mortivallis]PRW64762.1 hypothetical protein CEP50_02695 [Actinopolyspora mortivallis]
MTIYSQHPNRGKVQILATFRGQAGVMSSTVTSIDDAALAAPIVDALNRICACATIPVSAWDTRGDRIDRYPREHLAALIDRSARAELLTGAHSLWYELVKLRLHEALTDLDNAIAAVPTPVRTAITAELETEERNLREALAEYSESIAPPEIENRREWDSEYPFIAFEGGMDGLSSDDRDRLNHLEAGATSTRLKEGAEDLRVLVEAHARCTNDDAALHTQDLAISYEPFTPDRFFLDVQAPMPNGLYGRDTWTIEICQWDKDLDDPEHEDSTATGQFILSCVRSEPPTATEIVELLNRSGQQADQLAVWAKTPTGEALHDTTFVVTQRYDD